MAEQINTSIVIKQRGFLLGYTVSVTLWVEGEFEPLVDNQQWAFTKRKARSIAQKNVMAIEAIKQLQEAIRAGI
jgi:hypothetical protein